MFEYVDRETFREYFQPSRIILAVVPDPPNERYNVITLAFNMYCSYKPLLFAIAVHRGNHSYGLFEKTKDYCLCVPGDDLIDEVMFCGINSGEVTDKFRECNFTPKASRRIQSVGISECLMILECKKMNFIECGDHAIVVGEVLDICRNQKKECFNILSVSGSSSGYKVLRKSGIHRLAIVDV